MNRFPIPVRPELVEGLHFTSCVARYGKNKNGPSTSSGQAVFFGYA